MVWPVAFSHMQCQLCKPENCCVWRFVSPLCWPFSSLFLEHTNSLIDKYSYPTWLCVLIFSIAFFHSMKLTISMGESGLHSYQWVDLGCVDCQLARSSVPPILIVLPRSTTTLLLRGRILNNKQCAIAGKASEAVLHHVAAEISFLTISQWRFPRKKSSWKLAGASRKRRLQGSLWCSVPKEERASP